MLPEGPFTTGDVCTVTLLLTASLEYPNGQRLCPGVPAPLGSPAAGGGSGWVPFPLWAPGPLDPGVHREVTCS